MLRLLQVTIVLSFLLVPGLVSAGTSFTMTTTPISDSAVQGTATTNSYPTGIKATASGTYTGGLITLSSSIAYANGASSTPGITVTFPNNPFGVASGSLNSTAGLTVTTASGTSAGTYVVTIVGQNTSSKSSTNTYTLTVSSASGGPIVWTGAASQSWSTAANWNPASLPNSASDVEFYDAGGAAGVGTVDNIVSANMTIGSLTYGNTNNYHTTQINPGVTLTLADGGGLTAGTGTDAGATQTSTNTITGAGGALVISNSSTLINIGQADPSASTTANATLDLSGLGTFQAASSRLLVGVDTVTKGASGTLNLALTNIITMAAGSEAPQIDIGDNSQPSGATGYNLDVLQLGQTNAIYCDSIEVGRSRTVHSTMFFNSALVSPTAYFRGTNGNSSRVGTWYVGDGGTGKVNGFICNGTNDFSLGTVDAMVDAMFIGAGSSATGTGGTVTTSAVGMGTLTMGAGVINVNTLQVGFTVAANGTGTVNVNGGTLLVNNLLELANGTNVLGGSSGTLNISGGVVMANGGVTAGGGASTINLSGGALTATNSSLTIGTVASPLSAFNVTNGILNLAVQSSGPVIAAVNLSAGGSANTINLTSMPLLTGFPVQFPLIQYGLNSGTASGDLTTFVLGSFPVSTGTAYAGYLSNNVANNSIDIVITNGPFVPALVWDGVNNGNWDTTTPNWRPKSGPDTTYADSDFVTFDDTLLGTTNVNLMASVSPGSLTVSNSLVNYIFTGVGGITGSADWLKTGSGTLVLDNSGNNNSSGDLLINNGTVQVGNDDNLGSLPSGNLADNGTLVFNENSNFTVSNDVTGSGLLIQNSALQNTLTLTGDSSFTGMALVEQGTLQVAATNGLGEATNVVVDSGATLDVDGQPLFGANTNLAVTISGMGVGSNGAVINSSTNNVTKVLHSLTLAANAAIGGNGNWDIRNSTTKNSPADGELSTGGNPYNLIKVGTNTVTLNSVTVDPMLESINVEGGTLDVASLTTSLGDPNGMATVYTNATLVLDTLANVLSKVTVLNDGATLKGSATNASGGPVTFSGPVVLGGGDTFTANTGSFLLLDNVISGSGKITKSGSGVVFLGGAVNTFAGGVAVSGGTLALTNFNGIDGNIPAGVTNINVSGGATFDVSGRSDDTLTLGSGQSLSGGIASTNGPASINGIVLVGSGAVISPGGTTNNSPGTINISSNAVLQGLTFMKITSTNGNDQIDAYAIENGGQLVVTNAAGVVTNGQTFQLFVATNGIYNAGSFSSISLPTAPGLTWTTNLAVNGSITAMVVATTPTQPQITGFNFLSPTQLVFSGTSSSANYSQGYTYTLLSSTNVSLPLANWTTNSTGTAFNPGGNFIITNPVNPAVPQNFYLIRVP